jgi:polar amino acid transport system substrate-binding protein
MLADVIGRGSLRLALFPSFFYRKDRASGSLQGVGIEIGRALAEHLRVRLAPAEYPSPPAVLAALAEGAADVGLLGVDPARAAEVDFSPPLFAADFTYLVPQHSPAGSIAEADRPGTRIALVRHHAMDTALRGQLKAAMPVHADTPDAAFELFRAGKADVLAGVRPGLLAYADALTGARVLSDRYGRNVLALAVRKGDAEWRRSVEDFAARARTDGTIARAIAAARVRGIDEP